MVSTRIPRTATEHSQTRALDYVLSSRSYPRVVSRFCQSVLVVYHLEHTCRQLVRVTRRIVTVLDSIHRL